MSSTSYRFTFGHYTQKTRWTDIRALTWPDLAALLTTHAVGSKEGSCFVPAVFSGIRRTQAEAVRIEVAVLDSDTGATLAEIRRAISTQGWAAIIASTHSHLTRQTRVKRSEWERFIRDHGEQAGAELFLRDVKGYLPQIAAGAYHAGEIDGNVLLEHTPCPKFRVVIPLARPWQASDYPDWRVGAAAWKASIGALAAALGLCHDQACTDTSRLFYLPRRAATGPLPETAVLEGGPCDIFALTEQYKSGDPRKSAGRPRQRTRHARSDDASVFTDGETGEVFDLRAWAREYGPRFQIEVALRACCPEVFSGHVADHIRHHIQCPNDAEHTDPRPDAATFVINADATTETKGFVIHCRHAHCDGRDRLFFLRRMLEKRWLNLSDLVNPAFLDGKTPPRPLIRYEAGRLPGIVTQAEDALLAAHVDLYQRGAFVVRPGRIMATVSGGAQIPAMRAIVVGDHAMVELMTETATWERYDGKTKGWVRIDAPTKVARTYLDRTGLWRLPVLAGIVTAPTLRQDGSLLTRPGYDPDSGLLLDNCGVIFPVVPENPDRQAALAALDVLTKLIATFPFVRESDRAVMLSGILTACIRRSLPSAPLHAITAPTAGSGKSLLVDLISLIVTGREAGVIAQGRTEEEFEKRLGALLLAGDQLIAIDNCDHAVGGDFLCQILTQQVVRARVLGRSEAPELPSNGFVTATGNNLSLKGDMTRRTVMCRLDPKLERPELRCFAESPAAMVKANRGHYVAAALTLLRAYHIAGRPTPAKPLGSFKEWSDWVRSALLWLGVADPVETMDDVRESDTGLADLTAVLACWHRFVGDKPLSVRELIARVTTWRTGPACPSSGGSDAEHGFTELREALLTVAGIGGVIDGRRLGKWLAVHQNRIVGGLQIERCKLQAGFQQWRVQRIERSDDDGSVG